MALDITGRGVYPLSDLIDIDEFPLGDFLPTNALEQIFESLFYADVEVYFDEDNLIVDIILAMEQELVLKPPGSEAFALILGAGGEDWTAIRTEIIIGPDSSVSFLDASVTLRISEEILRNVETDGPTEITISGDILFSSDGVVFDNLLKEPISLPPTLIVPLNTVIESLEFLLDFSSDRKCFALKWTEFDLNRFLKNLIPNISEQSPPIESKLILQIIFGDPIEEIRLEWELRGISRTVNLPGFQVTTPDNARFSLLLGAGDKPLSHIALLLTLEAGTTMAAASNFAWERNDSRELHNDDERDPQAEPLISLGVSLTDDKTLEDGVTIVLVSFDLTQPKFPDFFRQLEEPITALDFEAPDSICHPFELNPISLELENGYLS